MDKRVVITGLGAITPIGKNVEENWNSIKEKKCGIDEITLFNTEIIGFGATTDAYHITSPCPDGEGGARACKELWTMPKYRQMK